MKVIETITRECCHPADLKPVEGCRKWSPYHPDLKFCIHCGTRWQYLTFMDAAGSTDWEYRKVAEAFDA